MALSNRQSNLSFSHHAEHRVDGETIRVTAPVSSVPMMTDKRQEILGEAEQAKDHELAYHGMLFNNGELLLNEAFLLLEDGVGHGDFADIVPNAAKMVDSPASFLASLIKATCYSAHTSQSRVRYSRPQTRHIRGHCQTGSLASHCKYSNAPLPFVLTLR